ncbi:MAG TPA: LPS-assembly protein LptD [Anaeromyxobacteraceae bacterium]|nr:LPS-assembly protein LptD [Anaeromyxobacteraceae bacterium]
MPTVLLALALLAAPPAPAAQPLEVLEAGEVRYDTVLDRGTASGGVVLRRGQVTLRAGSASWDGATGEVEAWDGVLLLEPGRAVAASRMHAVLDGPYQAHDVVAFLKEGPLDLGRCRTLAEARATGRNKISLGGAALEGASVNEQPGRFQVDGARITLCDCGAGPPSWEIRASHADVVAGDRAFLTWPVFYVTPRFLFLRSPVPVFALPVLYMPLADRQTGLLFPEITWGGPGGFGVAAPVFVTLGRSWDLTATPGYAFGPGQPIGDREVKGPSLGLELRWAPAEGARGTLRLGLLHHTLDLWPAGVARPAGLNRVALSGVHDQRLSDADHLRVDVGLVNDALYTADFTADALLRAIEYRRSAVTYTHREHDLLVEGDAAYHLSLLSLDSRVGFDPSLGPAPGPAPYGTFGGDLSTFHRLPSASLSLLPVRVAGPLRLSAFLGVARFAPLSGITGDEGANGLGPGERGWGFPAIDAGERDARWQPGERLSATRLALRSELRAPFAVGRALEVDPWLAATAAAYAFGDGGEQADARAVVGLDVSTFLSRRFGAGWRHVIEPRASWRYGTPQAGPALPAYAYDELDVPPPPAGGGTAPARSLTAIPGRFQQLQLSLRNRLLPAPGGLVGADLTLGQDVNLDPARLSETWVQSTLTVWRATLGVGARFFAFGAEPPVPPTDPRSFWDAFSEFNAGLTVGDGRGDDVHASLSTVGRGGSPRLVAGLEPLFDDTRGLAFQPLASGGFGVRGHLGGATAAWDAAFTAREQVVCPGPARGPHVFQHSVSLVWDSPCKCWRLGFTVIANECDPHPRWGLIFDVAGLGAKVGG